MTKEKKQFFQERTETEIKDMRMSKAHSQRGLVEKINELKPEEALVIMARIIPNKFFSGGLTGAQASRKCYKHGDLIPLTQPKSLQEAYNSSEIPLYIRVRDFSALTKIREEEINFIGYSWRPVQGRDRTKRIVPFRELAEGARLFTYAENFCRFRQGGLEKIGIKVEEYSDAKRVRKEGASIVVEVPSRTEKKSRYKFGLMHIPILPNNPEEGINYNLASILSFRPAVIREDSEEPLTARTTHELYNIRYTFEEGREESPAIRLTHLDVAGYLGLTKKELTEKHNITPLMYNPFALPSQHQASFYSKLYNNVLIFDPSLSDKDKLRKLHIAEKSILLGRAIGKFSHDDFAYWDPTRDGIYKDFNWSND